jgi:hypothetical protein
VSVFYQLTYPTNRAIIDATPVDFVRCDSRVPVGYGHPSRIRFR